MDEVGYTLEILSEKQAEEICNWRYEGKYSVYNFSEWSTVVEKGWDLSRKEKRESEFLAIIAGEKLIAYGRLSLNNDTIMLGIGLNPNDCGKGIGKDIIKLLIEEAKRRHPEYKLALEVRHFNERAIKCYESVGFRIIDSYKKATIFGEDVFYYMEYIEI